MPSALFLLKAGPGSGWGVAEYRASGMKTGGRITAGAVCAAMLETAPPFIF
jgi:hypothetical protein